MKNCYGFLLKRQGENQPKNDNAVPDTAEKRILRIIDKLQAEYPDLYLVLFGKDKASQEVAMQNCIKAYNSDVKVRDMDINQLVQCMICKANKKKYQDVEQPPPQDPNEKIWNDLISNPQFIELWEKYKNNPADVVEKEKIKLIKLNTDAFYRLKNLVESIPSPQTKTDVEKIDEDRLWTTAPSTPAPFLPPSRIPNFREMTKEKTEELPPEIPKTKHTIKSDPSPSPKPKTDKEIWDELKSNPLFFDLWCRYKRNLDRSTGKAERERLIELSKNDENDDKDAALRYLEAMVEPEEEVEESEEEEEEQRKDVHRRWKDVEDEESRLKKILDSSLPDRLETIPDLCRAIRKGWRRWR